VICGDTCEREVAHVKGELTLEPFFFFFFLISFISCVVFDIFFEIFWLGVL
jgi:hypothetical protein